MGKWAVSRHGLLEAKVAAGETAPSKAEPLLVVANVCLTPFLLVLHSLRIYCWPCLQIYVGRALCAMLCLVCSCPFWMYKDARFGADDASLGEYEGKGAGKGAVVWKRGSKLGKVGAKMKLFSGKIEPSDIGQGALGDCWLLSAIASLSEFDGAVQRCFANADLSARGKYVVRLFDPASKRWVGIKLDDRIPCDKATGRPCFTKPNGSELWVMLLEKAFAKLCGSYAALEGGHALWALRVMTGDEVLKYSLDKGTWRGLDLKPTPTPDNKRACKFFGNGNDLASDEFFDLLKRYSKQKCVLGAGTTGKDETIADGRGDAQAGGIVPGHAYTVLDVREVGGHKLLCLRNPWGSFEWGGDWSDKSEMWAKHKLVKMAIRPDTDGGDDGIFWMAWGDFLRFFDTVDVCVRETGLDDLRLDVMEDKGAAGPCLGCVWGCIKFWLCCCGCYKLWCARKSSKTFAVNDVKKAKAVPESDAMER